MKKLLKLVTLTAAALILALLPNTNVLQAHAAPTSFFVKYDTNSGSWRMQIGEWNDAGHNKELYYLNNGEERAKDGDIVVIMPNDLGEQGYPSVTIDAHLSNLTVHNSHVVVYAKGGADECHVIGSSYASINGNVTDAYVYDYSSCTFIDNVANLHLISTVENTVVCSVTVGGTVGYASTANAGGILKEYYNFAAGSFHFDHVTGLMTDESKYSKTGSGPVAQPAPAAAQAPSSGGQASQSSNASDNGYDDVPKTGDSGLPFLLLGISAFCFAGHLMLSGKRNKL